MDQQQLIHPTTNPTTGECSIADCPCHRWSQQETADDDERENIEVAAINQLRAALTRHSSAPRQSEEDCFHFYPNQLPFADTPSFGDCIHCGRKYEQSSSAPLQQRAFDHAWASAPRFYTQHGDKDDASYWYYIGIGEGQRRQLEQSNADLAEAVRVMRERVG